MCSKNARPGPATAVVAWRAIFTPSSVVDIAPPQTSSPEAAVAAPSRLREARTAAPSIPAATSFSWEDPDDSVWPEAPDVA